MWQDRPVLPRSPLFIYSSSRVEKQINKKQLLINGKIECFQQITQLDIHIQMEWSWTPPTSEIHVYVYSVVLSNYILHSTKAQCLPENHLFFFKMLLRKRGGGGEGRYLYSSHSNRAISIMNISWAGDAAQLGECSSGAHEALLGMVHICIIPALRRWRQKDLS